jgi:hypothetical protein
VPGDFTGSFIAENHHSGSDIIRFLTQQDFPIYQFYCPRTKKDSTHPHHSCQYCILGLKGYSRLEPDSNTREYVPLPNTPIAIKRWVCSEHHQELCDHTCDTFLEVPSRFLVWEWNWLKKKFEEHYTDKWDSLLNGYYRKEGKKEEESRITETRLRRNRGRPYDKENSRARKALLNY